MLCISRIYQQTSGCSLVSSGTFFRTLALAAEQVGLLFPRQLWEVTLDSPGLIRDSLSAGTWAYSKVWLEWFALLEEVGGVAAGEERLSLVFFMCSNLTKGVSEAGMGRKLSALAFLFKLSGEVDVTKSFVIRQTLKGYQKGNCSRYSRHLVSFSVLGKVRGSLDGVCSLSFERILFRVAFLLAFFGAFQVSELVSPSRSVSGGLMFGDVHCSALFLRIWIWRSKTDQTGRGVQVELLWGSDTELCPVSVITHFMLAKG